jgi:hypothetical protein
LRESSLPKPFSCSQCDVFAVRCTQTML